MSLTCTIPSIAVNTEFISVFTERTFAQNPRGGMLLTDRIGAQNFRLRESEPGYKTDWHVAGDPTLIIVQQGCLRIELQNGLSRDFEAGSMFIAADFITEGVDFDKTLHGHRASVIGNDILKAIHIKLAADFLNPSETEG